MGAKRSLVLTAVPEANLEGCSPPLPANTPSTVTLNANDSNFWCSVKSFWDFMDKSKVMVRGQGRHKHWTEYDFTDFSTKQKQNVQC
jgi:hypothetical protein